MYTRRTLEPVAAQIIAQVHRDGMASIADPQQTLFLIWCFANDFDNGGIAQFLFNSAGAHAHATVAALRRIDAHEAADILATAVAIVFPTGEVPEASSDRNLAVSDLREEVGRQFDALDAALSRIGTASLLTHLAEYWAREITS